MGTHLVVGYGTLLLKSSVGDTISQENANEKTYRPVIVRGFQRLFNLKPDHYTVNNVLSQEGIEMAAANVEKGTEADFFNGLAFTATEEELIALDKREYCYERKPVPIYDFETNEFLGEGFTYMGVPDSRFIIRDTKLLLPYWRDVAYARTGAYATSEAFGQTYDKTTYLADGSSKLVELYAEYLDELKSIEV